MCGSDGVEHTSAAAARATGARVVNCGVCGRCSNEHDTGIYHARAQEHTGALARCAVLRLLLGEAAAKWCLTERIGHTAECARCFADNMGCTIAHCYAECVLGMATPLTASSANSAERSHFNGTIYALNACFLCDELYCSPTFVGRCAGANRRTAGVVTDISRPDAAVCSAAREEYGGSGVDRIV